MNIKEQLTSELILSMKMKDKLAVEVIRLIKTRIIAAEKKDGVDLTESEVGQILVKAANDHQKSIIAFQKGGREDLVEKEKSQLQYLQKYLPKEMSEESIIFEVEKIMGENSYHSIQDMGKVMKEFNEKFQANGRVVSGIVKDLLLLKIKWREK